MIKFILKISVLIVFFSCQVRAPKAHLEPSIPVSQKNDVESSVIISENVPPSEPLSKPIEFGIIFSGGGVRTWGMVTLLKELQKYKMPIVATAGVEWGSVIAALYAQNLSANEVEWELSKFKDLANWEQFIKTVFEKKLTQNLKVPFGCTSLNLKNQTSYVLSKGALDQLVPFCIPSVGLVKPYQQSVSHQQDLVSLVQYLKLQGATKIILIQAFSFKNYKPIMGSLDSIENQWWSSEVSMYNKKNMGIDEIIELDVARFPIERFDLRKDVINTALPQAKEQLTKIARKYNY